ncbi:MAG: GNAT family N-acetyltransferase, partial [Candidatus Binatia bacterium]
MSLELRPIEPHERGAVLDLLDGWLSRAFFARYFEHDPAFRDDLCFVAIDHGRMVSTLQVFRKLVRVDGRLLRVGGVGNVYTDPAYRDRRLAGGLLERAIAAMDRQGFDASLLFAVKLDFYAHYGWRSSPRHLTFIEPGGGGARTAVESFDAGRDLAAVAAVYAAYSSGVAGATERDGAYWRGQLGYAGNPDERFVVARRGGAIIAYA